MEKIIDDFREYGTIYMNFPFDTRRETRIHPYLEYIFELQAHEIFAYNWLGISLHSNATGRPTNTAIHGADAYFMQNSNHRSEYYFANYSHENNMQIFADIVLDNIDEIGISRRYIRPSNFLITREVNIPMILIENGFHTNPYDRALLSCDDFLQKLAAAYFDAIIRYFEKTSQSCSIMRGDEYK